MAYTIYNTDGSVLLTLGEGKIDQKNTSLTLIGKNVNSYGEYFNNNLISLLANFSGTDEPRSPITGQLWYDTASGRMKVYDLNGLFRPITNTISGEEQPVTLANNDFWWDTVNEQIKFTPNGTDLYVIGPATSVRLGTSGWVTENINDNGGTSHTVTSFYNGGTRLGILSSEAFTFAATTSGMTSVSIGLTLNPSVAGIRFAGTATSADSIAGLDISTFVRNDINQTMQGSLTIENDLGLSVLNSTLDAFTIRADSTTHEGTIAYNSTDKIFKLQVNNGITGLTSALFVKSDTKSMGVWNESPLYPVDIVGTTRVTGQLIVAGTSTNITSSAVTFSKNNIELASNQTTPADNVANNGGITVHGTTDHRLIWKNNGTGWNANNHANLLVDPTTYTSIAPTGLVGTNATFTVINNDSNYVVTIQNTGSDYTTATSITAWSTTTPYVNSWSTTTPYIAVWNTGTSTFSGVPGYSINGTGTGFTLDISISTDLTYLDNGGNPGIDFTATEIIVFYGTDLGGTSPDNDLTITVLTVDGVGAVTDFSTTGTATWTTSTPFTSVWTTLTNYVNNWTTTTPFTSFSPANKLTIAGTSLGGVSPDNDVSVTITATNVAGNISGFTYAGTATSWSYKISSSTVITKTSLGTGIVTAPGLKSVGVMSLLTVTNIQLSGNTVEAVGVDQTLYLNASGTGTIDVSNNKITSVSTCTNTFDAANKGYVDGAINRAYHGMFVLTLDVTHHQNDNAYFKQHLDWLYPINNPGESYFDLIDGSRAKLLLATVTTTTNAISLNGTGEIDFTPIQVDQNGINLAANVPPGNDGAITITIPPQYHTPITTYTTATWHVVAGQWEPDSI